MGRCGLRIGAAEQQAVEQAHTTLTITKHLQYVVVLTHHARVPLLVKFCVSTSVTVL